MVRHLRRCRSHPFAVSVFSPRRGYFVAVFDVITERKQAETTLRETARRLELVVASSRLGVWDWDIKNNVMRWDDRMFELYGTPKEAFPECIDAWLSGLHPEA